MVSLQRISLFTTFIIFSAKVQSTPSICGWHKRLSKLLCAYNWPSASAYSIATETPWKFCSNCAVYQEKIPFF